MTLLQQFQADQKVMLKKELQRKYHPDKHPGQEAEYTKLFKLISESKFKASGEAGQSSQFVDKDKIIDDPNFVYTVVEDGMSAAVKNDRDYFYFETENWSYHKSNDGSFIPYYYPTKKELDSAVNRLNLDQPQSCGSVAIRVN